MSADEVLVVPMTEDTWAEVAAIYRDGIATGHATFETSPPAAWATFIAGKLEEHCHVAVDGTGRVVGWVAASSVSSRCVYAGVVEHSVYVSRAVRGRGTGLELLSALVVSTEAAGIWTIQSGVFPENATSLRLHERAGFRVVGRRERLGLMSYGPMEGQWRDVVAIERRSDHVGTTGSPP